MASTSSSLSLKEYLKRYESGASDDQKKKKKKKEKENPPSKAAGQIVIVDEDPVWQKPVQIEEQPESSGDEQPVVDEDIEVKRMKRLEAIRARKPYHGISEDGSGWVSISNNAKQPDSAGRGSDDLSPPRARRRQSDTTPRNDNNLADEEQTDLSPPRQRRRRADTPEHEEKAVVSGDSDLSPPRQHRRHADTPSPKRVRKTDVSVSPDLSPPRQHRQRARTPPKAGHSLDLSPPRQRRRRADTSSPEPETKLSHGQVERGSRIRRPSEDISPPRKGLQRSSDATDLSPPTKVRNADLSPPRRTSVRSKDNDDLSLPRKVRSADLSPPRRTSVRSKDNDDLSPPTKVRNADLSPPRLTSVRSKDNDDLSPPRRSQKDSFGDLSPPRRSSKGLPNDLSPPRKAHFEGRQSQGSAADLSPKRKVRKETSPSKESRRLGLLTGKEVKEEILRKRKEEISRFAALDASITGKGAEPVFRDKEGKRIKKEDLLKAKEDEKPKEKKLEWGKGLAQMREAEARAREIELEKEKPFARTSDDPDLDKMLRERIRFGDPMAHLAKRKNPELELEDLGDNEKMKESGFIIPQTIPSHSWIKRGIDCPPNRYGIRPGRHWDGVDRSNGFEKDMYKRQNERRATEREAYLWSVSEM